MVVTNMRRAVSFRYTDNMFIAWGFILLTSIQEDRMAPVFHHAAKVNNFRRVGAANVLCRSASVWKRADMEPHYIPAMVVTCPS